MQGKKGAIPIWFVAPFIPMVASQLVRLHQTTPFNWLLCDYSGRIGALLVLAAIPSARTVAFRRQPLLAPWWETVLWMAGFVGLFTTLEPRLIQWIDSCVPDLRLGYYPAPGGWLRLVDLTFGITLIGCHEEIVFRRCARAVFSPICGDGAWMVVATSLLFSAYHWWAGIGTIVNTLLFGLCAMLFVRRTGALWPVVVSHSLYDLICFF